MRTLAVIIDCVVLATFAVFFVSNPKLRALEDVAPVLFVVLFIAVNLSGLVFGDYGEREKLEELKRIDALTNNTKAEKDKDKRSYRFGRQSLNGVVKN